MHINRANEVTVSREPASAAGPISVLGLVTIPTSGTPATGASFGAGQARDVSLFGFVSEIVDIFAIFPGGHALVVVTTSVLTPHASRIANKESPDLILHTEINYLSGGLVTQITDTPFCPSAQLILGPLQFLPATGILLATGLLPGKFAKVLVAVTLQRANTAPRDDQSVAFVRGDGGKMDFAQVDRGLDIPRSFLRLWNFDAHMQLKPMIPDQCTGPTIFRQFNGQDQGFASFAHRQDDPSFFTTHGLSRPFDRIEAFGAPGVLHLRMALAKLARGLNSGKEGVYHHLNRLAMQGKFALSRPLQLIASRPPDMFAACGFMGLHAEVPDLCGFHLSRAHLGKHRRGEMIELVDSHRIHQYNSSMDTDGLQVGKTRYTHYSIAYHLVWRPKYRRKILTGELQKETKRLIVQCCQRHGVTLLALETDIDHIHVEVSAPPRFSPALIANLLKGYSSRYLREKSPHLKKLCGKERLWTQSYYVGTAGSVEAVTIKRYIMECQGK
jgi:putative transposase